MTFLVLPKKGWKNTISLRKSSTAERGNPFPVKNHLFFFFIPFFVTPLLSLLIYYGELALQLG